MPIKWNSPMLSTFRVSTSEPTALFCVWINPWQTMAEGPILTNIIIHAPVGSVDLEQMKKSIDQVSAN